jgi:DNA invertase Pin-like site-specific DNA recombinase
MNHVYMRVSTAGQNTRGQEAQLIAWAEGKDSTWYTDKATGTKMARQGFDEMMGEVMAGDTIVVWRLDRLGRTAAGLTALFDELNLKQVTLVSLKDSLDLSTPAGRMMAGVIASVAQYETEVRKERQMAGIEAVRAKNKGKCPWGGSKGGRVLLLPEKVEAIKKLYKEGHKITAIARAVEVSRGSIYRVIQG